MQISLSFTKHNFINLHFIYLRYTNKSRIEIRIKNEDEEIFFIRRNEI